MITNLSNGTGAIQAQGIGSGLDIQSLVNQLVTAEGAPVAQRLTRHASSVGTQLSAMGTLKGALATFQAALAPLKDSKLFQVLTATSTDTDAFSAAADKSAVPGSYDIEITQLAKAEQIISKDFAGGSGTVIGTGTLTLTRGATAMSVAITTGSDTLAGIRDAINSASNNPGIQAAILNTGTGSRLVLTSTATGAANAVRVASSGGALAQLEYTGVASADWTLNQVAQDANFNIAGVAITNATNTISGVIDGVTLTLKAAATGVINTLSIASDQNAVLANLRKFVDAYNAMRGKFDGLTFYDAASGSAGALLSDPLMNGIEAQMRTLSLNQVSGVSGGYQSLAAIGIVSDTKGKLVLDSAKLNAALAADRSAVAQLFGSANGVAARLDAAVTAQLNSSGSIAARDKSLADDQKSIDQQRRHHSQRMSVVQQRYLSQFTALDSLMAQLRRTSTFLTQQLGTTSSSG